MHPEKFVIIYDTYCGWCYGAAPLFDALLAEDVEVQALHRHLFQGRMALRLSLGKGEAMLSTDARISALTGQVFSQAYIDNVVRSDTEVLDSAYAAQAAALVHSEGARAEFAIRSRLETARFLHGVSASDRGSVVDALVAEGVPSVRAERIGTPGLIAEAAKLSHRAEQMMSKVGARGVPTVLRIRDGHAEMLDHAAWYGHPERVAEFMVAHPQLTTV